MTEKTIPSLAARLLAVMGEVGYIQKQGKTQSGPSFTYMKHDDVVAALRPALVKHGVAYLATVKPETVSCVEHSMTKSGTQRYKTTLMMDMTFVNIDDPGDAYNVSFPGEGIDDSDKGSGKALSYATKNGLLKTFMIESGDEADNEAATQETAPRPQAVRQDQQREQAAVTQQAAPAATPPPNGTITQAQAKRLHEDLFAKGRASKWFLGVIAGKGIGDGEHLTSIPSGEYERLLEIVAGFADPPPPEPTTPAAAPAPAESVSAADFAAAATLAQEPAEEVAAPAAASAAPEPEKAPEAAPAPQGGAEDDDGFDVLDDAIKEQAEKTAEPAGKAKRKATVTDQQKTRLGALCASLEAKGVGEQEWRTYLETEEGVRSRTLLTKAAATRMIDRLNRWSVDLQTGVVGASEGTAA